MNVPTPNSVNCAIHYGKDYVPRALCSGQNTPTHPSLQFLPGQTPANILPADTVPLSANGNTQ